MGWRQGWETCVPWRERAVLSTEHPSQHLPGEGWSLVGVTSFSALSFLVETAVVWYQGIIKKKYF